MAAINWHRGIFCISCLSRRGMDRCRYTADAIAERRALMALVSDMKGLVEQVDGEE